MKSGFRSPLVVRELLSESGRHPLWALTMELVYDSDRLKCRFPIPAGFVTDFASIPRWTPITRAFIQDRINAPAVLHDYLYQTHAFGLSRRDADAILIEAMEAHGIGIFARRIVWLGVRLGGGSAWLTGPSRFHLV